MWQVIILLSSDALYNTALTNLKQSVREVHDGILMDLSIISKNIHIWDIINVHIIIIW